MRSDKRILQMRNFTYFVLSLNTKALGGRCPHTSYSSVRALLFYVNIVELLLVSCLLLFPCLFSLLLPISEDWLLTLLSNRLIKPPLLDLRYMHNFFRIKSMYKCFLRFKISAKLLYFTVQPKDFKWNWNYFQRDLWRWKRIHHQRLKYVYLPCLTS